MPTMNSIRLLRLLACCVLVAPAARAILIDDSWNLGASNTLATNFAAFPAFAATGQIDITEGPASFGATGVLIAPNWVLTAAHNWTSAVTGITFTVGGQTRSADMAQLFQHPLWNNAPSPLANTTPGASQGWDIALFRLSSPIVGITPAGLYTGSSELGAQVYTLGFGRTGTGTTASVDNATENVHAISNRIDRVTSQTVGGMSGGQLFYDFDSGQVGHNTLSTAGVPESDAFVTELDPAGTISGASSTTDRIQSGGDFIEGGTAQGDSGGPTFIFDNGQWVVAGVTSWGINPADGYGTQGLYGDITVVTRVSAHIGWIHSVTAIPEPATYPLLIGLAVLAWSVGGRRARRA